MYPKNCTKNYVVGDNTVSHQQVMKYSFKAP